MYLDYKTSKQFGSICNETPQKFLKRPSFEKESSFSMLFFLLFLWIFDWPCYIVLEHIYQSLKFLSIVILWRLTSLLSHIKSFPWTCPQVFLFITKITRWYLSVINFKPTFKNHRVLLKWFWKLTTKFWL